MPGLYRGGCCPVLARPGKIIGFRKDGRPIHLAAGGSGLTFDSSSPAINVSGFLGSTPESVTSNTFSPPAGSVIIVSSFTCDSFNNDWPASGFPTITDSLGAHLTWNNFANVFSNSAGTGVCRVALWWAYCPSAQTGMSVTVTDSVTSGQYIEDLDVAVTVWTGANTTGPIGALVTNAAGASSTSVSQAITPTALGSALVLACGQNQPAASVTLTAGSGCAVRDTDTSNNPAGNVWLGTSLTVPTLTASLSSQTLSATSPQTHAWQYAAYEVLAAAGSPAVFPMMLEQAWPFYQQRIR